MGGNVSLIDGHIDTGIENQSICHSCFYSDVCEQFNEHRECDNKRCHFANDHFVPADPINRLQAENERLKQNLKEAHIDIKEHLAEKEMLQTEKDNLIKTYAECQVANLKEFVKRLEPLKQFRCCMLGNEYELSVTMREIDNLLKEMIGE